MPRACCVSSQRVLIAVRLLTTELDRINRRLRSKSTRVGPFIATKCLKDAFQVTLTSPQFLFLTENSRGPEPEPLDEFELASKLTYFLWNSPPDEQTLRLAREGRLRT